MNWDMVKNAMELYTLIELQKIEAGMAAAQHQQAAIQQPTLMQDAQAKAMSYLAAARDNQQYLLIGGLVAVAALAVYVAVK